MIASVTKQRGFMGSYTKTQVCEVLSELRKAPPEGLGRQEIMKRTGHTPGPLGVILEKHEKAGFIKKVSIDGNGNVVENPVASLGSRYTIHFRITEAGLREYSNQTFW